MPEQKQPGMKIFTTIWVGQLVSLVGSGLTSFALSIWILQHTSMVTQYTLAIVLASLPGTLISPFAGTLVDRWNRQRVLICADAGSALVTVAIGVLLYYDALQVWHIYIGVVIVSVLQTFQWPAYVASITLLVKKEQYGRVNGMLQFGNAATTIAAPALAGLLLTVTDIWMVLVVDFATFLFALAALLLVKIPQPEESAEGRAARGSIWKETAFGWSYITQRKGLLHLLLLFAVVNLAASVCGVALMPMVLGFSSEAGVGTIMSIVGVGMLAGSLLMTTTGGTKRKIHGILGAWALYLVCFVLIGLRPSLWLVGIGVFLWYAALPYMNSCSQAIWQAKVAPDVQGRVFAMRRMIAQFTVPIGDFSAGPLADKVFNPLLIGGGALAGSVGMVIGVGPGRGIALMYLVMAVVPLVAAVIGFLDRRVRDVEIELPDHVADAPAADEAAATGDEVSDAAPAEA
jgi:MFS family permease